MVLKDFFRFCKLDFEAKISFCSSFSINSHFFHLSILSKVWMKSKHEWTGVEGRGREGDHAFISMVLVLDGIAEIGAHLLSDPGYLICLRYLFGSRVVTNLNIFFRKEFFFHTCATCNGKPSNISAMMRFLSSIIWYYLYHLYTSV